MRTQPHLILHASIHNSHDVIPTNFPPSSPSACVSIGCAQLSIRMHFRLPLLRRCTRGGALASLVGEVSADRCSNPDMQPPRNAARYRFSQARGLDCDTIFRRRRACRPPMNRACDYPIPKGRYRRHRFSYNWAHVMDSSVVQGLVSKAAGNRVELVSRVQTLCKGYIARLKAEVCG
jgi:hypothetical protein